MLPVLPDKWDFIQFKIAFHLKTGLDLERYKDKQMERRIRHFMEREKKPDFRLFYEYLLKNPPAMKSFKDYLTINTSEFFRDEKVYTRLQGVIFPELFKKNPASLTIWSAGCSIGAEPYSVAIILDLLNFLERAHILATDLDEKALQVGREGSYNLRQLGKIQEHVLKRYFEKEGANYRVKPFLKKAVSYKCHNLLSDAPFSGCQMILCRNVFIYFKQGTQEFLLKQFSESLEPGGFLIMGASEHVNDPRRYELTKRFNTIYQRI
jgi:chemotaxis protein methyltransferase CheR